MRACQARVQVCVCVCARERHVCVWVRATRKTTELLLRARGGCVDAPGDGLDELKPKGFGNVFEFLVFVLVHKVSCAVFLTENHCERVALSHKPEQHARV